MQTRNDMMIQIPTTLQIQICDASGGEDKQWEAPNWQIWLSGQVATHRVGDHHPGDNDVHVHGDGDSDGDGVSDVEIWDCWGF